MSIESNNAEASTSTSLSTSSVPAPFPSKAPRFKFTSNDPLEILKLNRVAATPFQINKHKKEAAKNWDKFYKTHKGGFFLDRHWTEKEFEAIAALEREEGEGKGKGKVVMEVGCGTGAFVYPLLKQFPSVRFHAFDFSSKAVDLVKTHELYDPSRVHAFVHDLTDVTLPLASKLDAASPSFHSFPSPPSDPSLASSLPDIISCIFVLSALPPNTQIDALKSLLFVLSPSGTLILRDYAIHDQAQLRFHALPSASYASIPSLLSPDLKPGEEDLTGEAQRAWYRRGDSTLCYFFGIEEMDEMIGRAAEELSEGKWRLEGQAMLVEKPMVNRAEGWGCTRRFVQGSWKKVVI